VVKIPFNPPLPPSYALQRPLPKFLSSSRWIDPSDERSEDGKRDKTGARLLCGEDKEYEVERIKKGAMG